MHDFTVVEAADDEAASAAARTARPSREPRFPRYNVYVELAPRALKLTHADAAALDAALCDENPVYRSFRTSGAISPLRLVPVRAGAFAALRASLLETRGAANQQLKVPRVLRGDSNVAVMHAHAEGDGYIAPRSPPPQRAGHSGVL